MWSGAVELRLRTILYFGEGSADKLDSIIGKYSGEGVKRAGIVTGRKSYRVSGAWDKVRGALERGGVEYELFSRIPPNPTVEIIDEGVEAFGEFDPQLIVGIGGGSPVDASKAIATLLRYRGRSALDLYTHAFQPTRALPVVAVNLTHGTGTEVDRYAVATISSKRVKLGTASEAMYPEFSVDDPTFTLTLPLNQSLYVTMDALSHAVEAATTRISSPFTRLLSSEAVEIIARRLPGIEDNLRDLPTRQELMYAATLAGVAIDNSRVHLGHLLEHAISAYNPEVPHGLGLAVLFPAMLKEIYPALPGVLSQLLRPMVPDLKGRAEEAGRVAVEVERWIFSVGVKEKLSDLGFSEEDVEELVRIALRSPALRGTMSISPVDFSEDVVRRIFLNSLHPLSQ